MLVDYNVRAVGMLDLLQALGAHQLSISENNLLGSICLQSPPEYTEGTHLG